MSVETRLPGSRRACVQRALDESAAIAAIKLVARLEDYVLETMFTGKAMAGLLADVRSSTSTRTMWRCSCRPGGFPALFARAQEFVGEAAPTRPMA